MQYDLAAEKLNTKKLRAAHARLSKRPETHADELESLKKEMRRSRGMCALIEASEFFDDLTEEQVVHWMTELELATYN